MHHAHTEAHKQEVDKMSQELNIENIFKAEQVRLKPYYDMPSYKRELVYAYDVLGIHISRIEDVLEGKWLPVPVNANKEFDALVTEVRGLSRTDSTETEERESPPLLEVLSDKAVTGDDEVSQPRRIAIKKFYAASLEKFDDPKDRMIFIQCVAALDGWEELDLSDMYEKDFDAALIEYKEVQDNG
jgi:hypothetical protein